MRYLYCAARVALQNIFSLPGFHCQPQHRLERSIRNQHDARQARLAQRQAAEEIPMLQRALEVTAPPIALRARLGARAPLKARTLFRSLVDRSLQIVRRLGEFFAAGGPLS